MSVPEFVATKYVSGEKRDVYSIGQHISHAIEADSYTRATADHVAELLGRLIEKLYEKNILTLDDVSSIAQNGETLEVNQ